MNSIFDDNVPLPPGTAAVMNVTCMDVVMGRGSGTQNHCGNVTYRKLVFLNKELYATSSKFDKLKISKAIVRTVREAGGHFLEVKDGLHFDIGDKRAWDKTSQALREGQTDIRKRLEEEEARLKDAKSKVSTPSGVSKVAQYKQIISDQGFLEYSKRVLDSLFNPNSGSAVDLPTTESTPGANAPEIQRACGPNCPHARRRETLNKASADLHAIHQAMRGQLPSPLPHPMMTMHQHQQPPPLQQQQHDRYQNFTLPPQQFNTSVPPAYYGEMYASETTPIQSNQHQNQLQFDDNTALRMQPLPFNNNEWQPEELPYLRNFHQNVYYAQQAQQPHMQHQQYMQPHPETVDLTSEDGKPDHLQRTLDSTEPLPYNPGANHPDPLLAALKTSSGSGSRNTFSSLSSNISSLRDILGSVDFDMVPAQERTSMDSMLSKEIDTMIRNQSNALQYIDAFQAFEDLVFEEDSLNNIECPELQRPSAGGRISDLTKKDEMSLMNMSFLTIDDKKKANDESNQAECTKTEIDENQCLKTDELPQEIDPPREIEPEGSRLTFLSNISMMSMDEFGSFRDLGSLREGSFREWVNDDTTPARREIPEDTAPSDDAVFLSQQQRSRSRNLGFPMRKTVMQKYTAGLPTAIGQKTSDKPNEQVSSLTISEEIDGGSDKNFSQLIAEVVDPEPDEKISSLSEVNVSQMSMSSDF